MISEVEDKEGLFSFKSATKKPPRPVNPGPAEGTTTPGKNVLEAGTGKATSALSAGESIPGHTKSETAVVFTEAHSSRAATRLATLYHNTSEVGMGGAMMDQATWEAATGVATPDQSTSEESVGGTSLDQTTSEVSMGEAMLDSIISEEGDTLNQNTSEEAVRAAKLIQTPLASSIDNQTPPTSPVPGAISQISPTQLTRSLRNLKLGDEAQKTSESQTREEEGLLAEAAGGRDVDDVTLMQGSGDLADTDQAVFYAVTPMSWCPHLVAVCPKPATGLNVTQPCQDCGTLEENWVCLSCYQVYCSRFVNAHMIQHHEASGHPLVLSYVDLSVWCYLCQAYVHHQALLDVKNTVHQNKFGEDMPHPH